MGETIKLDIQLQAFVRQETRSRRIAVCPKIDVATQGESADDAKRCLDEAVQLWFEDCIERGTLQRALQECGFRTAPRQEGEVASAISRPGSEPDVLGDPFSVHVMIQAYESAPLMASA